MIVKLSASMYCAFANIWNTIVESSPFFTHSDSCDHLPWTADDMDIDLTPGTRENSLSTMATSASFKGTWSIFSFWAQGSKLKAYRYCLPTNTTERMKVRV